MFLKCMFLFLPILATVPSLSMPKNSGSVLRSQVVPNAGDIGIYDDETRGLKKIRIHQVLNNSQGDQLFEVEWMDESKTGQNKKDWLKNIVVYPTSTDQCREINHGGVDSQHAFEFCKGENYFFAQFINYDESPTLVSFEVENFWGDNVVETTYSDGSSGYYRYNHESFEIWGRSLEPNSQTPLACLPKNGNNQPLCIGQISKFPDGVVLAFYHSLKYLYTTPSPWNKSKQYLVEIRNEELSLSTYRKPQDIFFR